MRAVVAAAVTVIGVVSGAYIAFRPQPPIPTIVADPIAPTPGVNAPLPVVSPPLPPLTAPVAPKPRPPRRAFLGGGAQLDTFEPWTGIDLAPQIAAIPRAHLDTHDPWDPAKDYPLPVSPQVTDDQPWARGASIDRQPVAFGSN